MWFVYTKITAKKLKNTIDNSGFKWYNYSVIHKSYDEEGTKRDALQRAGGWCESVRSVSMYPSLPS